MRQRGAARPVGLAPCLLLACGLLTTTQAKYIFTEEPLLRLSPASGEQDLFGYAAALHRVVEPSDSSDFDAAIRDTKIIVGAPNGTFPGGLMFPTVDTSGVLNNTGLVYVCPVTPGECEALTGSGSGNDIRLFDYEDNLVGVDVFDSNITEQNETKSGQFMGATIVSTGFHLLVCAPRWISRNINDFMNGPIDKTRAQGRCYISGRNMTNFKVLRPCTQDDSQSLVGESYCMAGTAAALLDIEGPPSGDVVSVFLGGPPYDESSGAVFHYSLSEVELARDQAEAFTFIPKQDTLQQFWYSGTAVTTGRILTSDSEDLIYSLPKDNIYKGTVQVYSTGNSTIEQEISGEQMGEYFGWAVATADLNGDSFDEIIVGAPLYSTVDEIELGRMFIFRNNMGKLDTEDPIILVGESSRGRFGSAIVNLGDINSDGFEDIAVSAPFESQDRGAEGAVYIFLGSGETTINTTAEDVITALQISETLGVDENQFLKTFGYSLSSGVDVDANFNNELVIGAYRNQAIIVLRTYSIANISLSLSTDPDELFEYTNENCRVGSDMFACFDLVISAVFSGRGLDGRSLDVKVRVSEEAVPSGQRLFFNSEGEMTDSFDGFLNFSTTDDPVQKNVTVYVKNIADIDRRSPLRMVVGVASLERETRMVDGSQDIIDLRDIPLLNILPQNNSLVELSLEGCAIQNMCRPEFRLTIDSVKYLDSKREDTSLSMIVAGAVSFVRVTLSYSTLTEDAVDSFLIVSLPTEVLGAPQSIRAINGSTLPTSQCQQGEGEGVYQCLVHPIFSHYDQKRQVEIIIAVSDTVTGESCENCVANFTIFDVDRDIDSDSMNMVSHPLSVSASAAVNITEVTINPRSTQYEDTNELTTLIQTKVTLMNAGPSTIPQSRLKIFIPGKTALTGDFYYLYPHGATSPESVTCTGLNPDNLTFNNQQQRRRRRSVLEQVWSELTREERETGEEEALHKRQEEITTVNCRKSPKMCTPIMCNINDFGTRSPLSVVIISYLDNRFFRTQSGDFEFYIHAQFDIISPFVQGSSQKLTSNRLLVQEPQKAKSSEVPAWVFVVSAIGAVIALGAIILLLYLLGFFRLRKKDKIRLEREQLTQSQSAAAVAKETTDPTSLDSKPEEAELVDEKPPVDPGDEVIPEKAGEETKL